MELTGGSESIVTVFVDMAQSHVLEKRFPYGCDNEKKKEEILERYRTNVINISVFLYNKQGSEGEVSHNEAGTSRTYESAYIPDSFTSNIVPCVGLIK